MELRSWRRVGLADTGFSSYRNRSRLTPVYGSGFARIPFVSSNQRLQKFRVFDFFANSQIQFLRWGVKKMAKEGGNEDFIYRISTDQEWEEFQKKGSSFGGELDKSTAYYHLSKLDQVSLLISLTISQKDLDFFIWVFIESRNIALLLTNFALTLWKKSILLMKFASPICQVQMTLQNFFMNAKEDLYLLQIDPKKVCLSSLMLTLWNICGFDIWSFGIRDPLVWWVIDLVNVSFLCG